MNLTGDLVAFFTLKNRRINSNDKSSEDSDTDGWMTDEDPDEDEVVETTTPINYSLFEPTTNYFLGGYLSFIGKTDSHSMNKNLTDD